MTEMTELRHFPRRTVFGSIEIVDRQFDFVRAVLPYDYAYTSNSQQWDEAARICQALEGPMSAQGVMTIRRMDPDDPRNKFTPDADLNEALDDGQR